MKKPKQKPIKTKRYRLSMDVRRTLEAYSFILPFIIGIAVFFLFPIYISIKLSFGKIVKMHGFIIEWSGFEHYIKAFVFDVNFVPMFLTVVRQMLTRTPLILVFSLLIAVLINKKIKFRGLFRVVFFLPFILGTGIVLQQILQQQIDKQVLSFALYSLVPMELLMYLGEKVIGYVEDFFGVIVVVLWSTGVQVMLFLSGLQGITASLYESAKVDGASEWDMFWKITIPMIAPMMLLNIVYTIVDSFTSISNPILEYIQDYAFKKTSFEYAAAIGWIYFVFIIMVVCLAIGVMNYYIGKSEKSVVKRRD